MPPKKIIFDTDPGCDDVVALLYAIASSPDIIEVCLISVTYGNVDRQNCLRNVLSMFHVIEKEILWRKMNGLPEGFESLKRSKPIIAAGAETPLGTTVLMADYYHGFDGLGNIHATHPQYTSPESAWKHLFEPPVEDTITSTAKATTKSSHSNPPSLFTPSHRPSSHEILTLLRDNPPNTITLIAIGPLTNFATAAALDPPTFLRAKELLVMAGAIHEPGNITPVAEFNCIADPVAAACVYALTSPNPASTWPPLEAAPLLSEDSVRAPSCPPLPSPSLTSHHHHQHRPTPPPLTLLLFPLDITTPHTLTRADVTATAAPLIRAGSPLATWTAAFLEATFRRTEALYLADSAGEGGQGGEATYMCLHDPLPVWYALESVGGGGGKDEGGDGERVVGANTGATGWTFDRGLDVRVETQGQWTRGMHVVDSRRGMKGEDKEEGVARRDFSDEVAVAGSADGYERGGEDDLREVSGDAGGWLSRKRGNRLSVCVGTPGARKLAPLIMGTIFGSL